VKVSIKVGLYTYSDAQRSFYKVAQSYTRRRLLLSPQFLHHPYSRTIQ
jgi:hypothetical protein